MPHEQDDIIAFLSDPRSYRDPPARVECHETHGALVFLAGEEAWKIKKAVAFPYMDFSTVEKRRRACEREMEINRAYAPEIYLGCVPITRDEQAGLSFDGRGTVVEWAVHMRRFPQRDVLSNFVAARGIDDILAREIADIVLESHNTAVPAPASSGTDSMSRLIASVSAMLRDTPDVFPQEASDAFEKAARQALGRASSILDRRAREGYVRRCHGDLHLGNIVLWHGRPTLFDALEFDENLARIDTFYDLAFLLMDLDRLGHRRAANVVLNRYLARAPDDRNLEALRALPLFLGLRAAIRAGVAAERAAQTHDGSVTQGFKAAADYFHAALRYLAPAPARLVAVGGFSGTGKTTLAAALAPEIGSAPGAVHLRSDLLRKTLSGVDETTRLAPQSYTAQASQAIYATLNEKAHLALEAGHAVVVDAVFASPDRRREVETVASALGIPFAGLWLQAPEKDLLARVAARRNDASDATPDVVVQQIRRGAGPLTADWMEIDATRDPAHTHAAAAAALRAANLSETDSNSGTSQT